jgi:hypothetical protein
MKTLPYIGSSIVPARFDRNHQEISQRVRTKAVNTEVKIPMDNVTAKPLTGPEPSQKRMIAARNVVMLASRMVESALE